MIPRHDRQATGDAVGVSLITGFLGSGKTTLLNRLLQHPGMADTAVLINEFGEVGLDHLLVTELGDDVVLLSSGCICCTIQGALVDSLKGLYMKRLAGQVPKFSRVIIETTGLADPVPIVTCLMKDPLFKHSHQLESIVTTIDAVYGNQQLDDHPEAVKQVAMADRIVVTKTDLANAGDVAGLLDRLKALNPGAVVIPTTFGQVSPDRLFDASIYDPKTKTVDVQRWLNDEVYRPIGSNGHGHHGDEAGRHDDHNQDKVDVNRHDEHIRSFCVILERPVDWQAFLNWFEDLANEKGDSLLRVKGIINVAGEPAPYIVHCVQATRHSPGRLPTWPDDDRRSRIVFITYDLPQSAIEESLLATQVSETPDRWDTGRGGAPDGDGSEPTTPATTPMRWLNDAEVSRLFGALAPFGLHPVANLIRLMLLTGAGIAELATARWDQCDLDQGVWRKPEKGASGTETRRVSLASPALLLLRHMRSREADGDLLFPEQEAGEEPSSLAAMWNAVTQAAGIARLPLDRLAPTFCGRLFDGLGQDVVRRLVGMT